jgi:hypothetical protein
VVIIEPLVGAVLNPPGPDALDPEPQPAVVIARASAETAALAQKPPSLLLPTDRETKRAN